MLRSTQARCSAQNFQGPPSGGGFPTEAPPTCIVLLKMASDTWMVRAWRA